jgi:hypothetical protein
MAMTADQRICPDCGNPYPFDDEQAAAGEAPHPTRQMRGAAPTDPPGVLPTGRPPRGPSSGGGGAGGSFLAALAPYRTVLVLVGVLVVIVVVGYLLFSIAMRYFESGRPSPGALPNATPAPVLVPGLPSPGPSPSPSTLIQPGPSPSPSPAAGAKMKIINTDSQGANMRQRPSTTAPVLRTLPEGTVVEVIGGETNAEGRGWRNVRDPGGATGWIASELLGPE